jgi:hypothetical protein
MPHRRRRPARPVRSPRVWGFRTALVVACALVAFTAAPTHAQSVDDGCAAASPSQAPCTGAEKLAEAAAAECRRIGLPEEQCALPLGHAVSKEIVDAYPATWLHRAAAFQYRLGGPVPLVYAQWLGTHNSFNSVNSEPTLSHTDSNQQLSLTQQLQIDVRALELDLHWVPSPAAGGANAVVVCHGRGPDEANFGCTNEPRFADVLPQIATWLKAHPSQVILLYLEDELGAAPGYAETVSVLGSVLRRQDGSSMIYRPDPAQKTSKGCTNLPLDVSRDTVLAARAQVVLVGNCRSGWASDVFGWDDNHVESGSTPKYRPFPGCDATYPRSVYDSKLVRYYEDSTFVSAATDPTQSPSDSQADALTPARVASMTGCGVNLFGFDQLLPHDGRIEASVWSWQKGQPDPAGGRCAVQGADGRWLTRPCSSRRRAACRTPGAAWSLSARSVPYTAAAAACRKGGASFDVPRTGYENALLRSVAGKRGIWLRYRLR